MSTVQWEAIRDGIYDLRYLHTFQSMKETLAEDRGEIRNYIKDIEREIREFTDQILLGEINILSQTDPEPYLHLSAQDYWLFRQRLAGWIQELTLLRSNST